MGLRLQPYLVPFILYSLTFLVAAFLRTMFVPYVEEPFITMSFWLFIMVLFIIYIYVWGKGQWHLTSYGKITSREMWLIVFLFGLFVVHNFFMVSFSDNLEYAVKIKNTLLLVMADFTISSVSEEVVYRGFIQTYINQRVTTGQAAISAGNIFASVLMVVCHIGFFTVMDPLFAATALLLVAIFSLIAGYLRDRSGSLWIPVIVHILCNYIHILVHLLVQ